ncbi:MAG: hypothetical protein HEQ20_24115 [Aphanizomenon flos-aquae KM1D3_PB]|nr:hypothetical protein [Aphanizomenon flos-aquae]KHG40518.1 hypothetical protein OA07_16960 [Aphanizomenon flos-aquae 2012/KM1/D3]QSV73283.1 MAG: hypothetical protein HEQ20_24115 [Aphanizomenon flos-aquae KM1D3_PB]
MIRKIRNVFAHSINVASLDDQPHNGQLNELIREVKKDGDLFDNMVDLLGQVGLPEKLLNFCAAVIVLLIGLEMVVAVSVQLQPIKTAKLDKTRFFE